MNILSIEKRMHARTHIQNLKTENFYLMNLLMTVAWESDSWIALRNCSLKVREEPEYVVFAGENKKPVVEH